MATSTPPQPQSQPQSQPAGPKPPLQKPPGYRDPARPAPVPLRPPPRKYPIPPSDPRKRRRRPPRRRRGCCCCLCLVLLAATLAAALAGAACYFYFQPKLPAFHLQSLKVARFRVTVGSDGTFLDAAASAAVQATNPNARIAVNYGDWEVGIAAVDDDGDVEIGKGSAAGFVQRRRNSTVVRVAVAAKGVMVDDGVGARLKSKYASGEVKFTVTARARVGVGGSLRVPLKVVCGEVSLKDMGKGALPYCTINILKWINLH